jgi:hypothetical protein
MKRLLLAAGVLLSMLLLPSPSFATLFLFQAELNAGEEVPPTTSRGTGFGTVILDNVRLTIAVDLTFSDLVAPATVAHIHEAPFGEEGPPEFPLLLGNSVGQLSGAIPHQVLALVEGDEDVEEFLNEEYYFNVHSTAFLDGEIRGQVRFVQVIAEPAVLSLLCLAGIGLFGAHMARRRTSR